MSGRLPLTRLGLPERVDLFAEFLDENSHFGVCGLKIDRKVVVFETLARGGTDGRYDQLLASVSERLRAIA